MNNISIPDWVSTVASGLAIAGVFGAIVSRLVKSWLHDAMVELRPNGGGSTYDLVRKAARDAERAAHAAERACDQAMDVREQVDTMIERVSNLEQTVISWTPKKSAPKVPAKKSNPRGVKDVSS